MRGKTILRGFATGLIVSVLTSLPQVYLCMHRGAEWNGGFAYTDSDEIAYASYANALIQNKPRRTDPYTGKNPSFETFYFIQFVPAYAIAIPARLLSVSCATAFIALSILIAFASTVLIYLLLLDLTGNANLSGVGAVVIALLGAFVSSPPWDIFSPHVSFPFLRRYVPSFPFPFFIAMILFMWRAVNKQSVFWAISAALMLVIQIYSYFFMWTAAVAWLAVLGVLWFIAGPGQRKNIVLIFSSIALITGLALVPYFWLLANRVQVSDQALLLEHTRSPNFFRGPEFYGFFLALAFVRKSWRNPKILFALSLTIAPMVVFNQQVLTGRSLQPFHYEQFITNYSVLITSLILLGTSKMKRFTGRFLAVSGLTLGLAYSLSIASTTLPFNVELDRVRGVALELHGAGTVFTSNRYLINVIPTTGSNPILWSRYLYTFSTEDRRGQKVRFYKFLYYSDVDEHQFRADLKGDNITARQEIFGAERVNPLLVSTYKEITEEEIEAAVDEYRQFSSNFDRGAASNPTLSYAIGSSSDRYLNLDKWYERDQGKRSGDFIIYTLRLRSPTTQ